MDKRTLLAFGLIGIIIFLMPHYFEYINPPTDDPFEMETTQSEPSPAVPTPAQMLALPEESARPVRSISPETFEADSGNTEAMVNFTARTIEVETDKFVATLSTRGGLITGWRLKEHYDQRGGQLELLGQGAGGLTTQMSGLSLDNLEFVPSREALFLQGDDQAELTLTTQVNGKRVHKRILFQGNRYRAEVSLAAEGLTAQDWMSLGWDGSIADTEASAGADSYFGVATDLIVTLVGEEVEDWTADSINDEEVSMPSGRNVSWAAIRNAYFVAALMPRDEVIYDVSLSGADLGDGRIKYGMKIRSQYPGEPLSFGLMVGPLSYSVLTKQEIDLYGRNTLASLDELVQFGWAFFRPILRPMTILCIHTFSALHNVLPNYGFVIIVFSVLVKVFLFPLTRKSTESMARMQEIQPQMTALREKHANDQTKLNTEMMKLYKDKKVNPLGGCLPMFLQAPIMFSLFNLFRNAIELRQTGFVLWITDLSKPDVIAVSGFDVHILPLLMSAAMFVQQKMTMKDPKQAAMVYIMPVFMIWIFWDMSSGLVLYFTMYNLLSLFEQQALKYFKHDDETV